MWRRDTLLVLYKTSTFLGSVLLEIGQLSPESTEVVAADSVSVQGRLVRRHTAGYVAGC